jgi:hypothetical protein
MGPARPTFPARAFPTSRPTRVARARALPDTSHTGHFLGSFALMFSSMTYLRLRRERVAVERAHDLERERLARQAEWMAEYRARVENNMKGFEDAAGADDVTHTP